MEDYLANASVAESVFRPQYITGDANNKDCEEWFFDRIARNRPVPVPGDGMAITNVAQVSGEGKSLDAGGFNPPKSEVFLRGGL